MQNISFDEFLNQEKVVEPISNPRVGSCFSGVGMWELALKYLSIEHTQEFFIEYDKYPAMSYKAIHGDVKNYGDVTQIQGSEVEDIDVFFYSPPCQAFSIAGKGLGTDDARGVLFNDSLRIIQAKQPKICIMENVSGLTNQTHKHFYKHIIKSLEDAGYSNYAKVLNTKDYGVPQNRERIFIVSIRNDINKGYNFPEPFDNGLRLKDFLELEVDEKYYIPDEKCEKLLGELNKGKGITETDEISGLYLHDSKEFSKDLENGASSTLKANKHDSAVYIPCITPDRADKKQNGRRFKEDGDEMFTLTGQDVHGVMVGIDLSYNNPQPRDVANCISARTDRGISNKQHEGTGVIVRNRIRKLTPKECFRLQGIKDEDFEKAEQVNSNSQLYKQAGNGVSVNVVMEIIKELVNKGYMKGGE